MKKIFTTLTLTALVASTVAPLQASWKARMNYAMSGLGAPIFLASVAGLAGSWAYITRNASSANSNERIHASLDALWKNESIVNNFAFLQRKLKDAEYTTLFNAKQEDGHIKIKKEAEANSPDAVQADQKLDDAFAKADARLQDMITANAKLRTAIIDIKEAYPTKCAALDRAESISWFAALGLIYTGLNYALGPISMFSLDL